MTFLEKLLKQKEEKRNSLNKLIQESTDVEFVKRSLSEMETLNEEILEIRNEIKNESEKGDTSNGSHFSQDSEQRNLNPEGLTRVSVSNESRKQNDIEDLEYRNDFMNYVLKGEKPEERKDEVSTISDAGATVPKTVVKKIINKLRTCGNILPRVTMTNIPGGVEVPTSSVKPTATWVSEGKVADSQKNKIDGIISFSYYKLQVRVAVTLEASVASLSLFEDDIVEKCSEAMIVALEEAIINGSGTGQPLGITKDSKVTEAQKIKVKPSELKKYEVWSKIFAKVPLSKRQGLVMILNSETFEGDLMGMVDSAGQPIARVNNGLNGEDKPVFKGKEVIEVEDILPSYDSCPPNGVFGVIVNLKDYMINSNMNMTLKRYFDENTDQDITKQTMIVDGKLADHSSVILLNKVNEG